MVDGAEGAVAALETIALSGAAQSAGLCKRRPHASADAPPPPRGRWSPGATPRGRDARLGRYGARGRSCTLASRTSSGDELVL
ncbi:hypothetical protein AURDEDRAFT_141538 [Auricularia subglabra TFB-10046 SS5]|nr:hypothetical protein AURDEDRAFT_141538 [Auricularia subglabra TFB-10046 SS5]